jgi:hypothetical protein
MKKIYLAFCLLVSGALMAQNNDDMHRHSDFHPCGTAGGRSEWLKEYQRNAPQNQGGYVRNPTTTYLPLTLHLVGRNDSTGFVSFENLMSSFCQLNADFAPADIQFYIQFPLLYHPNSAWYSHDSAIQGGRMMLQENIANTINVYFVSSPAGNCGYNLPYGGIAMSHGCLGGHTFAHEMGHALGMPHTFLGWEGGQSWDNSVAPDYTAPAPARVSYNYTFFKDTMWSADTLIIDTAFVETVPRTGTNANCNVAADGFCDTPADYLAFRWLCSSTNAMSSQQQIDPNGVAFNSNGENIMSYAFDDCQVGFSNEQKTAMNAFIQARRQSYLTNQNPNNLPIAAPPAHISPAPAAVVPENNVQFTWAAVPNATHYYLEVFREPYASNTIISRHLVTDTNFVYPTVLAPRIAVFPYAWRVMAFNQGYTCVYYSQPTNFNTSLVSSVAENEENTAFAFKISPNPVAKNTALQFTTTLAAENSGELQIFNALGQNIYNQKMNLSAGTSVYNVDVASICSQSGLYFVRYQSANGGQPWAAQFIVE